MHCYSPQPPVAPPLRDDDSADVLLGVGRLLGQEVNLDAFLQTLVDRVAHLMQADRGTLYLLDPARKELFSRAAHLPEIRQIRLKLGQGVAGYVAQAGELVNVPDPRGERRFFADIDKLTGYRTESLLAVPLRDLGGEIFGVLQVLNRRGAQRFTEDDEALLTRAAEQVGRALEATASTPSSAAPASSPPRRSATSSTGSSASPPRCRRPTR